MPPKKVPAGAGKDQRSILTVGVTSEVFPLPVDEKAFGDGKNCVCVCMYVCVYTCTCVCLYVCMYACVCVCIYLWSVCMHVSMLSCLHVCLYVRIYECMHVCINECMYACMYYNVCMYACMDVYMYVYVLYMCMYAVTWIQEMTCVFSSGKCWTDNCSRTLHRKRMSTTVRMTENCSSWRSSQNVLRLIYVCKWIVITDSSGGVWH